MILSTTKKKLFVYSFFYLKKMHRSITNQNKENAVLRHRRQHKTPATKDNTPLSFGSPAPINHPRTPRPQQTPKDANVPPKSIRRVHGLFNAHPDPPTIELQDDLEPEYVPPRPPTPEYNAKEEIGFDLDPELVPLTQSSHSNIRQPKLRPLDLALEIIADIQVDDLTFSSPGVSKSTYLPCHPAPLSLIPRPPPPLRKRKRI